MALVIDRLTGRASQGSEGLRLSDVLFQHQTKGFETLAPLPSNIEAIEAALLFSSGLNTLTAIAGPSGWGKSHLLRAASEHMAKVGSSRPNVEAAVDWVEAQKFADSNQPLILDDVQDVLGKPRLRLMFRLALERRVRSNRATLLSFTAPKACRQIRSALPSTRNWTVVCLEAPHPAERHLVLRQIASNEGVSLSEPLIRLLASRLKGDGRTLQGAVRRLGLESPIWLGEESALRASGLLAPFFADNSTWDLRDHVYEHASKFPTDSPRNLAVVALRRVACMPESDIAKYFGISQGEVYAICESYDSKGEENIVTEGRLQSFIGEVVRDF
ncbi:MAG TPA: DnaA/Hda family protein [Fimbriimonadaceae bacterium]|nr:DnaA/Hda family protein [Fimbriimonadaceae bacterium]